MYNITVCAVPVTSKYMYRKIGPLTRLGGLALFAKTGGSHGLVSELLECSGSRMVCLLEQVFFRHEEAAPRQWREGLIVNLFIDISGGVPLVISPTNSQQVAFK